MKWFTLAFGCYARGDLTGKVRYIFWRYISEEFKDVGTNTLFKTFLCWQPIDFFELVDSNMPVHVLQFWRIEIYFGNLHVCLIITTTMSQICKSWSLHYSNYTRNRTGACMTQNQKDWRSRNLNYTQSQLIGTGTGTGTGRPAATIEFSDLVLLCSKNNNQCCSCSLSRFRPTKVIFYIIFIQTV